MEQSEGDFILDAFREMLRRTHVMLEKMKEIPYDGKDRVWDEDAEEWILEEEYSRRCEQARIDAGIVDDWKRLYVQAKMMSIAEGAADDPLPPTKIKITFEMIIDQLEKDVAQELSKKD